MSMTDEEIRTRLCIYDPRNPSSADLYAEEGDEVQPPRINCSCDNCFYGRDELAVELLSARAAAPDLIEALQGLLKEAGRAIGKRDVKKHYHFMVAEEAVKRAIAAATS